jgi:hypothetical protein
LKRTNQRLPRRPRDLRRQHGEINRPAFHQRRRGIYDGCEADWEARIFRQDLDDLEGLLRKRYAWRRDRHCEITCTLLISEIVSASYPSA